MERLRTILAACAIAIITTAIGCGGGGSCSGASEPVPSISSLSPSSVQAGSPTFSLTVNGSGFANDSRVFFNNARMNYTLVSGHQILTTVGSTQVATPGTVAVEVVNPAPSFGAALGGSLTGCSEGGDATVSFTIN